MKNLGSFFLHIGTYLLGHAPAIAQIVVDAQAKNIKGVVADGVALAAQS